tara:strand:+ start:1451 stop:1576 length:126 start_codon:yes stop_codon:yes gene_type:complete
MHEKLFLEEIRFGNHDDYTYPSEQSYSTDSEPEPEAELDFS